MCVFYGIYTSPFFFLTNMTLKMMILLKIVDDGHVRFLLFREQQHSPCDF